MAGPLASRNALAQSAAKVVQWARREEERVFIIGGAVSFEIFFFLWGLGVGFRVVFGLTFYILRFFEFEGVFGYYYFFGVFM